MNFINMDKKKPIKEEIFKKYGIEKNDFNDKNKISYKIDEDGNIEFYNEKDYNNGRYRFACLDKNGKLSYPASVMDLKQIFKEKKVRELLNPDNLDINLYYNEKGDKRGNENIYIKPIDKDTIGVFSAPLSEALGKGKLYTYNKKGELSFENPTEMKFLQILKKDKLDEFLDKYGLKGVEIPENFEIIPKKENGNDAIQVTYDVDKYLDKKNLNLKKKLHYENTYNKKNYKKTIDLVSFIKDSLEGKIILATNLCSKYFGNINYKIDVKTNSPTYYNLNVGVKTDFINYILKDNNGNPIKIPVKTSNNQKFVIKNKKNKSLFIGFIDYDMESFRLFGKNNNVKNGIKIKKVGTKKIGNEKKDKYVIQVGEHHPGWINSIPMKLIKSKEFTLDELKNDEEILNLFKEKDRDLADTLITNTLRNLWEVKRLSSFLEKMFNSDCDYIIIKKKKYKRNKEDEKIEEEKKNKDDNTINNNIEENDKDNKIINGKIIISSIEDKDNDTKNDKKDEKIKEDKKIEEDNITNSNTQKNNKDNNKKNTKIIISSRKDKDNNIKNNTKKVIITNNKKYIPLTSNIETKTNIKKTNINSRKQKNKSKNLNKNNKNNKLLDKNKNRNLINKFKSDDIIKQKKLIDKDRYKKEPYVLRNFYGDKYYTDQFIIR